MAFATFKGLPVSTTHAIVGSITAVAIFNGGLHQIDWGVLVGRIGIPMLVSPVLAMALTASVLKTWRAVLSVMRRDCVCIVGQGVLTGLSPVAAYLPAPVAILRFTRG